MLRDSANEKVMGAQVEVKTGRKWRADRAVKEAGSRLGHSDLVGTTTTGWLGLGCVTRSSWRNATLPERETDGAEGSQDSRNGKQASSSLRSSRFFIVLKRDLFVCRDD